MVSKQEVLLGRAAWVEGRRVREAERTALPRGSQSQVFLGVGLVSGLSLASHSELESFLVAYASLIQGGF